MKIGNRNDPWRNGSGYLDPTASQAIANVTAEEDERFHKLLYAIRNIVDLAGFELTERIVLTDKKTGREWR